MTNEQTRLQSVLDAISDPTRRAILGAVRQGVSTPGALAQRVPVSRPAVSQHLKHLLDARLVTVVASGTRRHYKIDTTGLAPLQDYLDTMWTDALHRFADFVAEHAEDEDND